MDRLAAYVADPSRTNAEILGYNAGFHNAPTPDAVQPHHLAAFYRGAQEAYADRAARDVAPESLGDLPDFVREANAKARAFASAKATEAARLAVAAAAEFGDSDR